MGESKENYANIESIGSRYLKSISAGVCFLFGLSILSVFSYNPIGLSISSSFGV